MMRNIRQWPVKLIFTLALQVIWTTTLFTQTQISNPDQMVGPLPEVLVSDGGNLIESVEQWEETRRAEILELFRDHVYGRVPERELSISHQVKLLNSGALDGNAVQKEVELLVSNGRDTLDITMLIYLPLDAEGAVPMFLGLNFNGNHTIHTDPQISITDSWVRNNQDAGVTDHRARESSRGFNSSRWPVELILSKGYGVATICCGDIDPDFDDGFVNGIHGLVDGNGSGRNQDSWGTIAAWAWGLSRAMDYFEKDVDIDQDRVAVIGHSRLGKTSLWAGANDERFAMVISNNSGCGGAALSRRAHGERVGPINTVFPHWFAARFREYNDNEASLPVDQHMLLALMAPRPIYVASAQEDDWADPYGEYLSLFHGSRVYGLYGEHPIKSDQMPRVDQPLRNGSLGYHMRTGKHDITRYDWEQYLDFAEQHMASPNEYTLENPVSMEWISEHIVPEHPRLILTPGLESIIRKKLGDGDSSTVNGLKLLGQSADAMMELEPLVFQKTGRRLLGVSREAIRRLTTLALVYRFEKDEQYLDRLEMELRAVCSFDHWNPSHFLDVGEMAAGIALALDWAGEWISPEVQKLARESLVDKAIKPGIAVSSNNFYISAKHNWNLVCNGGLVLAALAVFEDEPELASRIMHLAVESLPLALVPYGPGGVYPEGASYWFYATTYLTVTLSAFESALGTDFGFTYAPGVMESALFSQVLAGPTGEYYNFFDSGLGQYQSLTHFGLLAWFAGRSGSKVDIESYETLLKSELSEPRNIRGTRFFSTHFLNMALLSGSSSETFSPPDVWIGGGEEPVAIFRDPVNDPDAFFMAAKGGRAADNHGNMDAGSFIFELDGIRWSVDPGNQAYHVLEEIMGGELWNTKQNSGRWTLLTKNNFGHSTLSVNGEHHLVRARANLLREDLRTGEPEVTFDLSPLFGKNMEQAHRSFSRISINRLRITDDLVFSPGTSHLTWQMITMAEVKVKKDEVILQQDGKKLYLSVQTEVPAYVEIVELSPPPLPYDKDMPGLKRLEFHMDRKDFPGTAGQIVVELSNEK